MSKLFFHALAHFRLFIQDRRSSIDLLLTLAGGEVGAEAVGDDAKRQEVAEEARVLRVQELLCEIGLLLCKTPEHLCHKV